MTLTRRAAYGALGGTGGAFALTGLRKTLARAGLVHETAPQQVVSRLEELGLLDSVSPRLREALAVAAHLGYGAGSGAVFGVLRRETGGLAVEAAVGVTLGILIWGAGWFELAPAPGRAPAALETAETGSVVAGFGPRVLRDGVGFDLPRTARQTR